MTNASIILETGRVMGNRYRVDAALGQGSFGAVYRATDLQLGRAVALKLLRPHLIVDREGVARFRREAALAQRLENPNTVRLLDYGQGADGVPFIVWELLRGQPLDQLIRSTGPLPPARVVRIASQILRSLMEAHALGIVHRDIKPANVFVCEIVGQTDFVKVLDFGIARAARDNESDMTALTRQGYMVGTPSYMAPEQVLGGNVGPWSDLYAVGLVITEALTGQPAMGGSSVMQVCMAQASSDPVPIPSWVLASPLGPIVQRATRKDVRERYASAEQMLRDLEALARAMDMASIPDASAPRYSSPIAVPNSISGSIAVGTPARRAPADRAKVVLPIIFALALLGVLALVGLIVGGALFIRSEQPLQATSTSATAPIVDAQSQVAAPEATSVAQAEPGSGAPELARTVRPSTSAASQPASTPDTAAATSSPPPAASTASGPSGATLLSVTCQPVQCSVMVDLVSKGDSPVTVAVKPGPHKVYASFPQASPLTQSVTAIEGKTTSVFFSCMRSKPIGATCSGGCDCQSKKCCGQPSGPPLCCQ